MAEIIDFQARRLKKKFEDETYTFSAMDFYFPHIAQMQREDSLGTKPAGIIYADADAPFPRVPNG